MESAIDDAMLTKVLTLSPTARVERLREFSLNLQSTVSIDRARIETRILMETEGEPMITRRAKIFAAVAREMPIQIQPDELLLGGDSVRPGCVNISPVNVPVIERVRVGAHGEKKTSITDTLGEDEKRELNERLTPYWREQGKIVKGWQHYGHNVHNYEKVLSKGLLGIREDAEKKLAGLDAFDPDNRDKILFLNGVVISMTAAAEVGPRFAAKARDLAEEEPDAVRRNELLEMAEICDRVPTMPARTFREALQSHYFARMLMIWEVSNDYAFSCGRIDQCLYPYFESDVQEGRLSQGEAQELLDGYILKLNYCSQGSAMGVGGVKPDGSDAANELTYMVVESMMHTRLIRPFFAVHIHSKTPDALLLKACELCSLGTGHPQFVNSDVMVSQAFAKGSMNGQPVTLEDARSATNVGCVELVIPKKDAGYFYYGAINLASAMERVMTNGSKPLAPGQTAVKTGNPTDFKSFEEVQDAFCRQVAAMAKDVETDGQRMEKDVIDMAPTLFESALIEDCIENGACREWGGGHYNFNASIVGVGSTDASDSLTAIKKLVFEDKKIAMAELCDALSSDFEGHEAIRKMCQEVPKFGNDDDYADEQAAWVLHQFVVESAKMRNLRGGHASPGITPMASHVPAGKGVGALPSGRLAGEALADAASPSAGADVNGLTAALKSMGKVDDAELLAGVIRNMRIDPAIFKERGGLGRLADLMRAFADQKIHHMQINAISSETLRAAQEDPEKFRDLVVKVAGYSAYFTQLTKPLQESIIARTTHGL
jgi:formate C-acetyltransferase